MGSGGRLGWIGEGEKVSAPWGSPIRRCQTCGNSYLEEQVEFFDGICIDCIRADEDEEAKAEAKWQSDVTGGRV